MIKNNELAIPTIKPAGICAVIYRTCAKPVN